MNSKINLRAAFLPFSVITNIGDLMESLIGDNP